MSLSWHSCPTSLARIKAQSDDFLVILPSKAFQLDMNELESNYQPSMKKSIQGLNFEFGFRSSQAFAVLSQKPDHLSLLELRWLFTQFLKQIEKSFLFDKITVLFDLDDPTSSCFADDIYCFFKETKPSHPSSKTCRFLVYGGIENEKRSFHDRRIQGKLEYASWVNMDPGVMTSLHIGARLEAFAKVFGCSFESLDEVALEKENMRLLLAVGGASKVSPPRCHFVKYKPDDQRAPLLLIGKGITFDTGGINLKPFESHVTAMRNDMAGAALMIQLFFNLVELGVDYPISLIIPCCENAIDVEAMRPGSLIHTRSSKTVYIEHTDAEGRLILADAIDYAHSKIAPKLSICAATLTTASLRQFTNFFTPVHFADSSFESLLRKHAKKYGEGFSFWDSFLPFAQANDSGFADITNMGRMPSAANIGGGSNVAAHFLKQFAKYPFIHFDIFASAWNWSQSYPASRSGATGAVFDSLVSTLQEWAETQSK